MTRWLSTLLILLPLSAFGSDKLLRVTLYGDDNYPPYSYLDNNLAKGVYVEIIRAVVAGMPKFEVEIKLVPWKRGLKLLEQNRAFALFPPYRYSSKRPYIHPYSLPILEEQVVVYCNRATVDEAKFKQWPHDFAGLTVGLNDAFELGGSEFWLMVARNEILIRQEKGNRHGITSLFKGRSDCYMNDQLSIVWELKNMRALQLIGSELPFYRAATVSSEHGYLAFSQDLDSRYSYKDTFISSFNTNLARLKSDGTIDAILEKYTIH